MRQLDFAGHEHTIGELPRGEQLAAFDRAAFSARVPGTLALDTDRPVSGAQRAGGDATRPAPCPRCRAQIQGPCTCGRLTPRPGPWRVAQTDCRTGWLVVDGAGHVEPYSTRRRRDAAQEIADRLNAAGELPRDR